MKHTLEIGELIESSPDTMQRLEELRAKWRQGMITARRFVRKRNKLVASAIRRITKTT